MGSQRKYTDRDLQMIKDFVDFCEDEMGWMVISNLNSVTKNWVNTIPKRGDHQLVNVVIDYKRVSDNKIESDIKQFLTQYGEKVKGGSGGKMVG